MVDPAHKLRNDVLIVAGGAWLITVAAFAVLGQMYYETKLIGLFSSDPDPEGLASSAAWTAMLGTFFWSFATFITVGTIANAAAVYWPREVGHGIAAAFGLIFGFAGGSIMLTSPMPILVGIFVAALGVLLLSLAWASWARRDRAAWAFLLALSATLTVATFFGAPKIKAVLEVDRLWYVMLLPAVMAAVTVACYRMRRDYP